MFNTRSASESRRSCSSRATDEDFCVSWTGLATNCSLRERDGIAYLTMSLCRSRSSELLPTENASDDVLSAPSVAT